MEVIGPGGAKAIDGDDYSTIRQGVVISNKGKYGFIRPKVQLPKGFKNGDVHFYTDLANLEEGRTVEFILNENFKDRPTVKLVWLCEDDFQDNVVSTKDNVLLEKIPGIVVTRREGFGFIRPHKDLPDGFVKKDVHFLTRMADVDEGEEVEFILHSFSREKPAAKKVWSKGLGSQTLLVSVATPQENKSSKVQTRTQDPVKKEIAKQEVRHSPSAQEKKSEDKTAKKSLAGTRTKGKIVHIAERYGHLQVIGYLAEHFTEAIFFPMSSLHSGGIEVKKGDVVEFSVAVNKKREGSWMAHGVRLVQCIKRSQDEISLILAQVLSQISSQLDSSDVIIELMNRTAVWNVICNAEVLDKDSFIGFLHLMQQLESKAKATLQAFKNVLQTITTSRMCDTRKGLIKTMIERHWQDEEGEMEKLIKGFFLLIVEYLPEKGGLILALAKNILPSEAPPLVNFFYEMLKKVVTIDTLEIDHLEWNELPLVPGRKELFEGPLEAHTHLTPVKQMGEYKSTAEYMDTYFRLLRADCFDALCSGIKDHLDNRLDPRDMKLYHGVEVVGVSIQHQGGGIAVAVKVIPKQEVLNWSICSNLMFGNLLCFSTSGTFEDPIWATVKHRDAKLLKKDQIIWVELCSECNVEDDMTCIGWLQNAKGRCVLAESPTYYLAYQPVLKVLKQLNLESLSFQEELIHMKYSQESECFQNSSPLPVPDSMDKSQEEAYKYAFQQRISIIQGPPGTGKTFIGLKIIEQIMKEVGSDKLPVLVLTYKNHALDEFLKAVLDIIPGDVARVGGRSKDPEVDRFNIRALKRSHLQSADVYKQKQALILEAELMKGKLKGALKTLERAHHVSPQVILHGFSSPQIENLLLKSQKSYCIKNHDGEEIDLLMLWDENKSIIQNEELSFYEKMLKLGEAVLEWIELALIQWLPRLEDFQNIATHEERLAHIRSLQSINNQKEAKAKVEKEDPCDETDLEDEQKERMSSASTTEKKLEMTVKFDFKPKRNFPQILPSAERLAKEVSSETIAGIPDIWGLDSQSRAVITQVLLFNYRKSIEKDVKKVFDEYDRMQKAIKELDNQHVLAILREKKVVGMTITGASIHNQILQGLKPAIILVEEAAEVLEPQLMAVLGESAKQLFLIGDHKQLRPQVKTYKLVKDYDFDLSLMERLINNNYPYMTLRKQNRMRPEMAELLKDIYPHLESNLDRVLQNKAPDFIGSSIFFWHHSDHEGRGGQEKKSQKVKEIEGLVGQGRSLYNIGEAERALRLAILFVQQGYNPSDITILAAYQGQVTLLRNMYASAEKEYPLILKKAEFLNPEWDDYGDLDLAVKKSEEDDKIKIHTIDMYQGDENKIVIVSLVRSNPEENLGFLKSINRRCVAQSRAKCGLYFVGNADTLITAKSPWSSVICSLIEENKAGDEFPIHCPHKHLGSDIKAVKPDDIPLDGICKKTCNLQIKCGLHLCQKNCQPNHSHHASDCHQSVTFTYDTCGHAGTRQCSRLASDYTCKRPCESKMDCGIHSCPKTCAPKHSHSTALCTIAVNFRFRTCGHEGKKKCGESTSGLVCEIKTPFKFINCSHSGMKKCYQQEADIRCNSPCNKMRSCKHPCEGLCHEPCDQVKCTLCEKVRQIERGKELKMEKDRKEKATAHAKLELERLRSTRLDFTVKELHPVGDTAAEYIMVEDRVKRFVQPSHNWFPNVTKISKVINPRLEAKWLKAKMGLFDPTRNELKFHGTSDECLEKIIKEGFRTTTPAGKMFGGGIYFATDSSKSAQGIYTKGSNKLLLVDVLIGKTLTVTKAINSMTSDELSVKGYDSLFAKRDSQNTGGVRNDEYVIYNPDQALPKYIIEYNSQDYGSLPNLQTNQTGLVRHEIRPKRFHDMKNPLDVHYCIAESKFLGLATHRNLDAKIKSVEYYSNPILVDKFNKKQKEFEIKYKGGEESQIVFAFHGTPDAANVESIMKNNLKIGTRFAYGRGIYFSEFPEVSIGYAGGTQKLLLCQILPGKSTTRAGSNQPIEQGYDSIIVGANHEGRGQMVIIDNPDQILPTYVINY